MLFWGLFVLVFLMILYSYQVHFKKKFFLEIEKAINNCKTSKKRALCTFKGSFSFNAAEYDVFLNDDFIVLIKNYNILNDLIQNLFPENYIIIIDESDIDKNWKQNFLKYIKVTEIKNTNNCIKIKGLLHTKLVFNNSFIFEREIELTIQ